MCDVVTAPRRPALRRGARLGLLLLAAVLAWASDASPQAPARPRLLMVTYSVGYQHDVVRRASPELRSLAEQTAEDLGALSVVFDVTRLYLRQSVARRSAGFFT